ncbi:MAG: hypothetical protein F4Y86_08010 [Gammaproteobacteria bacterium]|nr:hypothetical protein [Gammaproteobacteria bacterium]
MIPQLSIADSRPESLHPDTSGDHSQGPRRSRKWLALLGLAMALLGCRGGPTTDTVAPTATPPTDWFCEATGAEWNCVEEEDGKVASRQPAGALRQDPVAATRKSMESGEARIATAAAEPATQVGQSGREQRSAPEPSRSRAALPGRPAPGLANLHRHAAEPNPPGEPFTGARETDDPAYRHLAYRPDREVPFTDLPDEFYAVQLLALASPEAVERFVAAAGVPGLAAARVEREGRLFYVLLLGIYRNRPDAMRAVESSPTALRHLTPWIRPMHTLKQAMLRADQLAAPQGSS